MSCRRVFLGLLFYWRKWIQLLGHHVQRMLYLPLLLPCHRLLVPFFLNWASLSIPVTTMSFNPQSVTPLFSFLFFNFFFPAISSCLFYDSSLWLVWWCGPLRWPSIRHMWEQRRIIDLDSVLLTAFKDTLPSYLLMSLWPTMGIAFYLMNTGYINTLYQNR